MKTARVHHAARRRGGGVAARGARAAAGDAGDRMCFTGVANASSVHGSNRCIPSRACERWI